MHTGQDTELMRNVVENVIERMGEPGSTIVRFAVKMQLLHPFSIIIILFSLLVEPEPAVEVDLVAQKERKTLLDKWKRTKGLIL